MSDRIMKASKYVPFEPLKYVWCESEGGGMAHPGDHGLHPFEYTGWWDECLSWHDNCYIHAGLNPAPTFKVKGPDAKKLMLQHFVNTFDNYPVGKGKHGIVVSKRGYIQTDGMVLHTAEDEYLTFWLWPYLGYAVEKAQKEGLDVEGEDLSGKVFFYQLSGPRALEIVEQACQEDLHDLPFIHFRDAKINGMDVMILRVGMAGSLAYEVHGKVEDALAVYDALLKAGEPYGIRRLGRHAYRNTHTEGGYPQSSTHFWLDADPEYGAWMMQADIWGGQPLAITGSADKTETRALRTPYDVGWGKMVKFDHDFNGREALEPIAANPPHTLVTLEWDEEDIIDIWKSAFPRYRDRPYKELKLVEDENFATLGSFEDHTNKVMKDGKDIGVTSARIFSPYYGKSLSLATIDVDAAVLDDEVIVLWGDEEDNMKEVHCKIARYPYVDKNRNQDIDLETIPHFKKN